MRAAVVCARCMFGEMENQMAKKTGFIGLGIMGSRMAMNLQKAGAPLVVYNRSSDKADALVVGGAVLAESPAEVAAECDVVYTMLSTPAVVREVALGENGFLDHLSEGSLWVDCSTVNPSFNLEMNAACEARGIRYLDAPVAGTKGPAEAGQLLFLVGGTEEEAGEITGHLDAMGKKTLYFGARSKGAAMKMLINQLLGLTMLSFAETLRLGEAQGIPLSQCLDVLLATPVAAPFLSAIRPKLENAAYDPNFPLQWLQKDLHLAAVTAFEHGAALPTLNTAKEVYALARNEGYGEKDFTAVFEFLSGR